jgi:hypothetical protein
MRTGETAHEAEVDYATVEGSAKAGIEYEARSGRLHFAPLETSKSISIPLHPSPLLFTNRVFTATLKNPSPGTLLGADASTVSVRIHSRERPGGVDFGFTRKTPSIFNWVEDLAIQPDGKLIVAGRVQSGSGNVVARLNQDGSLDPSWGFNVTVASQNLDCALGGCIGRAAGNRNTGEPEEIFTMRPPSLIKGSSFCIRKKTPLK